MQSTFTDSFHCSCMFCRRAPTTYYNILTEIYSDRYNFNIKHYVLFAVKGSVINYNIYIYFKMIFNKVFKLKFHGKIYFLNIMNY